MAPSNGKNLDYLIPEIQKNAIITGALLPPGAQYPDGSPIGDVFSKVPVTRGARIATMWRYRTEGQQIPDPTHYEHPYDSGLEITRHVTNYEKLPLPLTRYSGLDGRDTDHLMGVSAPDDLEAAIGQGLRECVYVAPEAAIAAEVTNVGAGTGWNAAAAPAPGAMVDCTAAPWTTAAINPYNDAASGLLTALRAAHAAGKYPTDILMGAAEWDAFTANPLAILYVRGFMLNTPDSLGVNSTFPMVAAERSLVISPYPAVKVHVGMMTYQAGHAVDGTWSAAETVSLWSGCLLYCKGQMIGGKPSGQHFCLVADGGDEYSTNAEVGWTRNMIDYKYNLYACHNIIDWNNATYLYNLVA